VWGSKTGSVKSSSTSSASKDLKQVMISDINKLKEVLEDVQFMTPVYRHFLGGEVVSAKLNFYEHPEGIRIKGLTGRYWVFVSLKGKGGAEYDVALWKVLKASERRPRILEELLKYIEPE